MNSIVSMTMKNIIISSLNSMTTQKELDQDVIETLQTMIKEEYPMKEIVSFLEAKIDLSITSVGVVAELNIVEVIQSLEKIFPQ